MQTRFEWLRHNLLSLIALPLVLAVYAFRRPAMTYGKWGSYLTVGLAVMGATGLLTHQHPAHPGQDAVIIQHRFFAGTSLLMELSPLPRGKGTVVGKAVEDLFPHSSHSYSLSNSSGTPNEKSTSATECEVLVI